MSLLLILITLFACLTSLRLPWIGVVAYYLLALGRPQGIWPWIFQDSRITLWITVCTLLGLVVQVARKTVDLSILACKPNVLVLLLCILVNLSHLLSPYEISADNGRIIDPSYTLSIFNKSILFYFTSVLLINSEKKFIACLYMLFAVTVYYVYWANQAYFGGEFWRFGDNGRLNGPDGLYVDENTFSMVFIIGMPVVYYLGLLIKRITFRYVVWLTIPLLWHAVFLTGSRGGLLALGAVTLYIGLHSYSKKMSILMVVGLLLASAWQGGAVLERMDVVTSNGDPIYADEAVDPRLISWQVGLKMLADNPILGVGVEKFIVAFPEYSYSRSYVAHNTFLQFASNSGLAAGLIYLWFLLQSYRSRKIADRDPDMGNDLLSVSGDMLFACMLAFYTSAIFLDLMIFEYLYFLWFLAFARTRFILKNFSTTISPNATATSNP